VNTLAQIFLVEYATKLDLKTLEAKVLRQHSVQEKFMTECRKKGPKLIILSATFKLVFK